MHKHIIHSKAMHNRKTFEIKLPPLPAREAKQFFNKSRSLFETAKFLMVFGGIPKYLEQITPEKSLESNIDNSCFLKNGFYVTELETIFKEQFKVSKTYEEIVHALADKSYSKEDLSKRIGIPSGGGLTGYLNTLENAGFTKTFTPGTILGKGAKTRKIILWDEWLRFYFHYMAPQKNVIDINTKPGMFNKTCGASIDSYFGRAFELLCMKNMDSLMAGMDIDLHDVKGFGPFFRQRSRKNPTDEGLQIDILINRKGHVLTVIECKFSSKPTGSSVIQEVQRKLELLKVPDITTIERVLVCSAGVTSSLEKSGYFHHILGLKALFDEQ